MGWREAGRALGPVLVAAAVAATAVSAGGEQRPTARWQVDWGDEYCTLVRLAEGDPPLVVAMRTTPGTFAADIMIWRRGRGSLPRGVDNLLLLPSARRFDVRASHDYEAGGESALALFGLPDAFWDELARAGELQLRAGEQVRRRIHLDGAAEAVQAHRQCASEVMREWGVDEPALRALSRLPATTNSLGIRDSDYPPVALRNNRQGRVIVRVAVGPDGRATDCAPVTPTSRPELEGGTCSTILRRARFTPPLDARGQPASAAMIYVVSYTIWG